MFFVFTLDKKYVISENDKNYLLIKKIKKMKKEIFWAAVAAAARKSEAEIEAIYNSYGMQKLMDEVILPSIVRPTGQDIRGWYIGDDFMSLMAKYGEYIAGVSGSCYDILAEIAMQRLSHGAVLHEPTPVVEALPPEYRKYSSANDQPGLMSEACWEFYRANAKLLLARPRLHTHAAKIARGIITHSDDDGCELGGYMWGNEYCIKTPLLEARRFCMELLDNMVDETFEHITADNWLRFVHFLNKHQEKINWKSFYQMLGVGGLFQGKERRAVKGIILG